jgi:hypothetical protein
MKCSSATALAAGRAIRDSRGGLEEGVLVAVGLALRGKKDLCASTGSCDIGVIWAQPDRRDRTRMQFVPVVFAMFLVLLPT